MSTNYRRTVYAAAASLIPDGGQPNPEYERALLDLACTLTGDEPEVATQRITEHGGHFTPEPMDPPHQPQRLSDFPDTDPWEVPLGEGYEGPSIVTTIMDRYHANKPEPIEYRNTDQERVYERVTPHHHDWRPHPNPTTLDTGNSPLPSWSPDYGTGQTVPKPPIIETSDRMSEPTGLVHGPRLGPIIDMTDGDDGQPRDGSY